MLWKMICARLSVRVPWYMYIHWNLLTLTSLVSPQDAPAC